MMRILNIDTDCTDNGEGLRTVIYVSGCIHACKGCHNVESWNKRNGDDFTIREILDYIKKNPIADVTISGGDPLTYQYEDTLELSKQIKKETNKTIWIYTGYTYEQLERLKPEILNYADVIIDGRFELAKRDLSLKFRGSSNQRIIDVNKTKQENKIILWDN